MLLPKTLRNLFLPGELAVVRYTLSFRLSATTHAERAVQKLNGQVTSGFMVLVALHLWWPDCSGSEVPQSNLARSGTVIAGSWARASLGQAAFRRSGARST